MKEGDSLDQLRSDILFLLCKRKWDSDGSYVTPAELHKALLKDGHPDLDLRSVKRSLDRLKKDAFIESARVPRPANHSGPPPHGYRIAANPPLITRRSTAQIVVRLHHHQRRVVPEQEFIAEMLEADLRRDDTGSALTAEDLTNRLAWCISHGYIRIAENIDDPEDPGGPRPLCTTSKVHVELLFLERICPRKGPTSEIRAIPLVREDAAAG